MMPIEKSGLCAVHEKLGLAAMGQLQRRERLSMYESLMSLLKKYLNS